MSAGRWNGRQINVSRENRQQKEHVPNRDTGIGNGRQPSANLDIL